MSNFKDLTNLTFGKLKVNYLQERKLVGKRYRYFYSCSCSCGRNNNVIVRSDNLTSGRTTQCPLCNYDSKRGSTRKLNKYDLTGEYGIGWTCDGKDKFYFDLEDYDKIKKFTWYSHMEAKTKEKNYIYTHYEVLGTVTTIYMHRLVTNCPENFITDHKNHNPRDNRKSNLRICSYAENNRNRKSYKRKVCGLFQNSNGTWTARIGDRRYGTLKELGTFKTEEEAIQARLKAEEEYFKEFSFFNSVKNAPIDPDK